MRVQRIIIVEKLFPITQLEDATTAAPAYQGIVKCCEWLRENCGVLHRDISITNLMYRKGEKGIIDGVLNDFDLARYGPPEGPQSQQRTGTKLYMSIDLLDPNRSYPHLYRHDLESIYYVMLFHFCGHRDGEEIPFRLQNWREATTGMLRVHKQALLMEVIPPTTPRYAPLRNWVTKLRNIFRLGYMARSDAQEPFEEETLGGHVTFSAFWDIIKPMEP